MESECPLLASILVWVALSCMFSMPKGLEVILHHCFQYSALKIPLHFTSIPCRSVQRTGPVRPEPILSVLRNDPFHLQTGQSDRLVLTNGKWAHFTMIFMTINPNHLPCLPVIFYTYIWLCDFLWLNNQQLFLKSAMDLSKLSDLIISQPEVTTVIKVCTVISNTNIIIKIVLFSRMLSNKIFKSECCQM